jgi:solute carrier family 25 (mitochondrial adenine nucleotide translocator), member 4/5/6/31
MSSSRPFESATIDFVIGSGAKVLTMPLDYVKLILQCQPELVRAGVIAKPYSGAFECVSRTINDDGISAFYRGLLPTLLTPLVNQLVNSVVSPQLRKIKSDRNRSFWVAFISQLATGALAGAASVLVSSPLEYARNQLACDLSHKFTGLTDVLQKTIASDGFFSIYRSIGLTLFGIIAYRATYFGLYATAQVLIGRRLRTPIVKQYIAAL